MAKAPYFVFLDHGQELIVLSNGLLDLSADLLLAIWSLYTAVKVHKSQAYRNTKMTREFSSFTSEPKIGCYPNWFQLVQFFREPQILNHHLEQLLQGI